MRKIILRILKILFLLNIVLSANSIEREYSTNTYVKESISSGSGCKISNEMSEVSLDLYCGSSMVVMVVLSSLLGMFFMKDEFSGVLS